MTHNLPTLDRPIEAQESNRGRFFIETVLRHWILIAVSTAICAASGVAIGIFMLQTQQSYWAETDLVVKNSFWQSPALISLDTNVFGDVTPSSLLNRLDMNAFTRDIAEALIQEDLAGGLLGGGLTGENEIEARSAELLSGITIEPYDEKGLLRLRVRSTVSHEDAVRTAEIAARALVDHTQLQRLDEQRQAYEAVQQQLDELRNQLDSAESAQWDFREKMGFRTHEQVWTDIEAKNTQLIETMAMKDEIRAKLVDINYSLEQNANKLPSALGNVTEAVVQELLAELDKLRRKELELGIIWKQGYPELDQIRGDIAEKKEAVLLAIGELNGGAGGSSLWRERQELYRQKVDLNSQLTHLDIRGASLEKILSERLGDLPDLADKSFEYTQLTHEADQIRDQFGRLLEKEFELRTSIRRGMATVERRNAASPLPIPPGQGAPISANGLAGLAIGALLSVGYAMLREMNDTSIKSAADLRTYIDLEDIGTIPDMWAGRGRPKRALTGTDAPGVDDDPMVACIVTQHDPKSPVSEAYRSLRTNFQFATLKQKPKTIMVTSSLPGEGKTTTAVNFAVTMSDLGKRVVIVDTDLRRPNVHRALRMKRGPGLADVLRNQAKLEEVIFPTESQNLWMISSGRVPENPSELISSEAMANVMKALGSSFDLVVCDAPSTLVVTDPVLLATHVDSIILVVSVNRTRRETVLRAKKIIETANPNIAGAVLNGLKVTSRHYYYYYYYYDERARKGRRVPHTAASKDADSDSSGSDSDSNSA